MSTTNRPTFTNETHPRYQDGNPEVGQKVTIYSPVGRGESIDTEPGLQPWDATCVGYTADRIVCGFDISDFAPEGVRTYSRDIVRWL